MFARISVVDTRTHVVTESRHTRNGRSSGTVSARRALAVAVAGLLLIAGAQDSTGQDARGTYRSTVDLVTLHVTVTDNSGRYVPDLEAPEFKVFENGRPQELRVFEPGGLPLAVMLFLDISSSMRYVFPEAQEAAIEFVHRLRSRDVASIVAFGDHVTILHTFTGDRHALERAIRQAQPHGATRLYNALYVGLKELGKSIPGDGHTPRRRVAVLLTDGQDTASLVSFDHVLDFAKRSDIAIYAVRLMGSPSPGTDTIGPGFVLNQLTRHTGGRAFPSVRDGKELRPVYEDIRAELAQQYALGYVSNDGRRDGSFRHLTVQVLRPRTRARTRLGYFAPLALVNIR